MPDVFLSYSREDAATARRFAAGFEREGFTVWWDATLRSGEAYDEVTENALRAAKAVVVLWSKKSVASRWVRAEATMAHRNKTLVPVMIEPCDRPIMFELTQTADLGRWQGDARDAAWLAFVADVRRFVHGAAAAPPVPAAAAGASAMTSATGSFAATGRIHVAVLPFANMSADPEQEYFADGITEDIITDLSKVASLGVTSRNSAFTFKGKHVDVRQVARQLDVTHVLEGSVRKAGNRVRITAQLIEGATDNHLWAERFDRDLSDIFALQDEIAQAIVAALKVRLVSSEREAIEDRGTQSTEAYDLLLRARAGARTFAPAPMMQAIQYCRQAISADPGYALAWATMATTVHTALLVIPEMRQRWLKDLEEATTQAVALAPDAWFTQHARYSQCSAAFDWIGAEEANLKAVGAAPSSETEPLLHRVFFLWAAGRLREACACLPELIRREPLSLYTSTPAAMVLWVAGRIDEAEAEFERTKEFEGDHALSDFWSFLRALASPELAAEVGPRFERFLRHESFPLAVHQELRHVLKDRDAVRSLLARAAQQPEYQDSTRMAVLGLWAARYGDLDQVISCLRRTIVDFGSWAGVHGLWEPGLAALRNDPRFKALVREIGLADYWRRSGHWADDARAVGKDDFEFKEEAG
jgi:TolB-like protein